MCSCSKTWVGWLRTSSSSIARSHSWDSKQTLGTFFWHCKVKFLLCSFRMGFKQGDIITMPSQASACPSEARGLVKQVQRQQCSRLGRKWLAFPAAVEWTRRGMVECRGQEKLELSLCITPSCPDCPSTAITLSGLWEYCVLQKCKFRGKKDCGIHLPVVEQIWM